MVVTGFIFPSGLQVSKKSEPNRGTSSLSTVDGGPNKTSEGDRRGRPWVRVFFRERRDIGSRRDKGSRLVNR